MEIRYLQNESRLLKGNPMGDPYVRRLPVYLPPGFTDKPREPYPVIYLLSGWGGRGVRYLDDGGAFTPTLPESLDRLIASGEMRPVIVAFPDGTTKLGASQYVNSDANGPYMDYLCDELVDFVDRTFPTHREPRFRGLVGHSSGGFGALATAMLRPDRFLNLCSSAGDSWYEYLYVQAIPTMIRVLAKVGGVQAFIEKFLSSPNPLGLLPRDDGETMMNLSICACYAPNLSVPVLKGDLYFDPETGDLVPEIWKKFLAWDPVYMVGRHVESLKKLRWIHLEAGTEDEYGLHIGHRKIARKLLSLGVGQIHEEYPGKHGGHHYRMSQRIQRMVRRMYED